MNQYETVKMLKEVYQSSKTAMDAISMLMSKTDSAEFRESLKAQLDEYHDIADQAVMQLYGYRELPEDMDVFTKLGLWSSVQMNTVTNKNVDHMAEIMISGSTMGIIDMTRFVRSDKDIDGYAVELGNRLIDVEQKNIDIMRRFL